MSALATQTHVPGGARNRPGDHGCVESRWHLRYNPKRELWLAWWTLVVFYNFFGLVFFVLTRAQPPPNPAWDTPRVVQWFHDNHFGILVGFAIMFVITGMTTMSNALIAYSMRRMSVSRVFGYSLPHLVRAQCDSRNDADVCRADRRRASTRPRARS